MAETVLPLGENAEGVRGRKAAREATGKGVVVTLQRLQSISYARDILPSPFRFQVSPLDELPQSYAWSYTDYETIGAGTHSRAGSPQLMVLEFSSVFLDRNYGWSRGKPTTNRDPHPVRLVQELRALGDSMLPFQVIVHNDALWGLDYDVNMAATLRSFRPLERAGEDDARYYSIAFTEFRGIPKNELTQGLLTEVKAGGHTYLAVYKIAHLPKGLRTMRALSKHHYKTATLWRVIAKASGFHGLSGTTNLYDHFHKKDPQRKVLVPKLGAK